MMSPMRRPRARSAAPATALALTLALSGCVFGGDEAATPTPRLSASDFRDPDASARAARRAADESGESANASNEPALEVRTSLLNPPSTPTRRMTQEQARDGIDDVAVLTGPPAPPPERDPAPVDLASLDDDGEAQINAVLASAEDRARREEAQSDSGEEAPRRGYPVDAMVGHINGRPLFANEFFEPMDERLRAEAERMPPEQWLRFAREQVQIALRDRIRDELLLAELESSLTPEQRTGLLAFVGNLRDNLVSQNRGSPSLANERLLTEEGVTLDEKVLQERNRVLISEQLRRAVGERTFVSWREVRQAYERQKDMFDTPPVATLRMVWASSEEAGEQIARRIEAGEPFAQIASDETVNVYQAASGGVRTVTLEREQPYSETEFFAPPELDEAARSLEVGEVVGPIDYNGRRVWLHLESIVDEGRSLYEAQLELEETLRAQRFSEEQSEYFTRLINRASLSDIEQMERRLFELAAERYLFAEAP